MKRTGAPSRACRIGGNIPYQVWGGIGRPRRPLLLFPKTDRTATRTGTSSPALHAAGSRDLIRVHGARVNNLKDVSVEIPKRRLTVVTGVSGSGKISLVFGTIAA